MEKTIKIESLRVYPTATQEQISAYAKDLLENDRNDLLLFMDPANPSQYIGIVLRKYYTPSLTELAAICENQEVGQFQYFYILRSGVRIFINSIMRRLQYVPLEDPLDAPMDVFPDLLMEEESRMTIPKFLETRTPLQIENELNEHIIGQPDLTKAVADFLYYHALRQLHPQLPQRPLMICGPSGSGKTEVWRVALQLYGELFPIKIIDGSNISCEGWSGSFKINSYINSSIANGGILVVDEFDKLAKPKHNSSGDNVSLDIQSEFLKLMEGEYQGASGKRGPGVSSQKMGFVLVGAFEKLRENKKRQQKETPRIGFCTQQAAPSVQVSEEILTDEDFIGYGIMPEIVGRIASKCCARELSEKAYLQIIRNPHSRVAQIEQVLKTYGVEIADVLSNDQLRQLIAASKHNRTGVRWVSAQVEGMLLDAIRGTGLSHVHAS